MAKTASNLELRHKSLIQRAEWLFGKKAPMLSFWQEIAENFYPQRADFTFKRQLGIDFADNLSTSAPLLVQRDLAYGLSSMLRPPGTTWAHMNVDKPADRIDHAGRAWLESKTRVMFRAMGDSAAQFSRATSEADADFSAFGQAVISLEINPRATSLLYRTWHLRDMAWCEKFDGTVGFRVRKCKYTAQDLYTIFGAANLHPRIIRAVEENGGKNAYKEFEIMHVVVPTEEYDYKSNINFPYVSVYLDVENKWLIEEKPILTGYYIIPRWQTVSGTQYAHSPATVAALPDARLLQSITFTLLKAGEKAVDPPMIGTQDMVKSPIDIQPGGITWVDGDYDERLGEALRPMSIDSRGIPTGLNMQDRITAMISSAFYLDKMKLPPMMPDTTAFEIAQRLREYIRQALPLFGPIEREYNAPLCEDTFTLLLKAGAFGSVQDIPESLQGSNIQFKFESPLVDAEDQQLVQTFQDTANLLALAAQIDPSAIKMLDAQTALRETLRGRQTPETWVKDEETMAAINAQEAQKQQAMEMTNMVEQGAVAAEQVGMAQQAMNAKEK